MPGVAAFKFKVCLAGEPAVGKTSLVQRFILDQFDDRYMKTVGTKTYKKLLQLKDPDGRERNVTLMIWDIMGQRSVRHLLMDAYFEGVEGILAVCDLTRPETLKELRGWILAVRRVAGDYVPVVVVGNKVDLEDACAVPEGEFLQFCEDLRAPYVFTSAKTGYNVAVLFNRLARLVFDRTMARRVIL